MHVFKPFVKGTVKLTRQRQKGGSAVWLLPLPVIKNQKKSSEPCGSRCRMHWELSQQILLRYRLWGLMTPSLLLKQKAEVFNNVSDNVILLPPITLSFCIMADLDWFKKKKKGTIDWWYPLLGKCKAYSLPCSMSYLVPRKLNSVIKGHLDLLGYCLHVNTFKEIVVK